MHRSPAARLRLAALAAAPCLALAACGGGGSAVDGSPTAAASPGGSSAPTGSASAGAAPGSTPGEPSGSPVAVADPEHAVPDPGPLRDPLLPADLLVYAQEPLSDEVVDRVEALPGVEAVERLSIGQVAVEDQVLDVAVVDPASYRRFTPVNSAQLTDIWTRVAGGELAILPGLGKRLQDEAGYLRLGNAEDAPQLHIGAYAPQVPQVDAVVNETWRDELGMPEGNALLVSTGMTAPQAVQGKVDRAVGGEASVQALDVVARFGLDPDVQQTAYLTGGSVAEAVGTFSYRVLGGGRIQPDAGWVAANIRTEVVPILGRVTCHRVMLPQFRAALAEIVSRGLADEIVPGQYAGCYYPRFIAGSTQLSLHSWGIAFDVNVPGNLRGTVGDIDRDVVAIFQKWGFAWGGDWSYTDPMHFELARLVEPR
ncbi:M15 family metallopeptidase [Nocardioides perillae]|uniref:Peptidase M15C domain-containing protein n=1 Tax=Nocardioides perillae TaxID=1119534 RepID=A0A7Y9RS44_9ACTN|nr:M15 family metallopeptidase [Nocardioides perillae]NYG54256.1 hypothetical protein [Nocardioides perillae]